MCQRLQENLSLAGRSSTNFPSNDNQTGPFHVIRSTLDTWPPYASLPIAKQPRPSCRTVSRHHDGWTPKLHPMPTAHLRRWRVPQPRPPMLLPAMSKSLIMTFRGNSGSCFPADLFHSAFDSETSPAENPCPVVAKHVMTTATHTGQWHPQTLQKENSEGL